MTDTLCMLVGSCLQCRGVQRSGLSPIGYILRHQRLSLAMLHAWTVPAHDALRLMVDTYKGRKAMVSWRRPPGRPHNVWLKIQEDANALLLSMLWRSEIVMGHGAAQRSHGIRDDDDGDDDEGCKTCVKNGW